MAARLRTIRLVAFAGTALWLLGGCSGPATLAETPEGALARVALEPLVRAGRFSGAVVLGRHGKILYEQGFGQADRGAAVRFTPDTPSDGASLAKTMTAALVVTLVAEGQMELDAPATRYLPEFPDATTTLRHLITHSNGLPDYTFFDKLFEKDAPRDTGDLLNALVRQSVRPAFAPGSRFEYGNLGYDLAALAAARASGKPFAELLAERFFKPLDMSNAFLRPALFRDWPVARTLGYRAPPRQDEVFDVFEGENFHGGSNVYLSARDLHKWVSAFARRRGLPAAALAAATETVRIGRFPSGITLGNWYCNPTLTACYYTGELNAFWSFAFWDSRTGATVVYVSNSSLDYWERHRLERQLVGAVADPGDLAEASRAPSGPEPGAPPLARIADASIRRQLPGVYVGREGQRMTITDGEGALRVQRNDGLVLQVHPVDATTAYVPGLDAWIAFSGDGRVGTLHWRNLFDSFDARRP